MAANGSFKSLDLGATGRHAAAQIARQRNAQGLSYVALSNRLEDLGWPLPVLALRRIEAGARRVTVDDLFALAVALGVSPVELVTGESENTPAGTGVPPGVTTDEVLAWARNETGLSTDERLDYWSHAADRAMAEIEEWQQFEATAKNGAARKLAGDRVRKLEDQLAVAVKRLEDLNDG